MDGWAKLKRSGGYRRKVLKAYRRINQLVVSDGNSKQAVICDKEPTVEPTPIQVSEKGSVENLTFDIEEVTQGLTCERFCNYDLEIDSNGKEEIASGIHIVDFRCKIKSWAQQYNINHIALRSLSLIINERTPNLLPDDPRTIMNTPRTVITTIVEPGHYWHNGLIRPLTSILKNCVDQQDKFSLNFNIDGLPVCNSSKQQFWPILCTIFEKPEVRPFIVGIYAGLGKPKDVNKFLSPFVEELQSLLEMGLTIGIKTVQILVRCFICDSPARAMIKGVCNFNGKHGCNKCTTVGEYSHTSHTVIFPEIERPLRNNDGFRNKAYGAHHKFDSVLLSLPIDMIEAFPVADALHLIDLGIMKRLLVGWRDGNFNKKDSKWRSSDIEDVNIFLNACKTPQEIHRSIRNLEHLSHWKGSELRTFFLYLSVVILPKVLNADVMCHFLTLFCAITICSNENYFGLLSLAHNLVIHFIKNYKVFYGTVHITSNVHNLSHLVGEVRRFGKLQSFDAYQYENKLHAVKRMLRQGNRPLSQVAKRLGEFDDIELQEISNINYPHLKKNKKNQMYVLHLKGFVLSAKPTDRYFLTNSNDVMKIKSIRTQNHEIRINCVQITDKENIFSVPIMSSILNMFKCTLNKESDAECVCFPEDVKCKFFGIEYKLHLYLIPLLHTV